MLNRVTSLVACLAVLGLLAGPDSATGSSEQRRTTLGCLELDGVIAPLDEVAFPCVLSALLDNPIDQFIGPQNLTRAGVVNPRVTKNLVGAGRCFFGEEEFEFLNGLRLIEERDIIDPSNRVAGQDFGRSEINGVARAARAVALRDPEREATVDLDGDGLPDHPMHSLLSNLESQDEVRDKETGEDRKLRYFETLNGLGFDPNDPASVTNRLGFDRLLDARPDRDRAHDLSSPGFAALGAADTVCELALGMQEPVSNSTDQADPVLLVNPDASALAGKPLFIGPDGVKSSADDLPIQMCPLGTVPQTMDFGSSPEQSWNLI